MYQIITGDALTELKKLPDNSINCCITSPPYYGLRDYGTDGQIGLEETPSEYIEKLVTVFREVRRVLKNDGTLWLNMGDSYAGSGKGSGSGYGYGYGKGNGSGNGSGNGDGYGSGYGYGNGYGSGYSSGYGIKSLNGFSVHEVDGVPTIITHVHGNIAKGYILRYNVYLEPCYIAKGNGYFAHGDTVAKARSALEEKILANLDTEGRIAEFIKQFEVGKKYPAKDFYKWHNRLTGSCEPGRRAFAEERGIDVDTAEYTVEEFINMTKNSFGGEVIRQLANELGLEAEE